MNAYEDEQDNIIIAADEISNEQIQRMAAWGYLFQRHIETIAEKYLEAIGNNGDIIGFDWGAYANRIGIHIEVPGRYRDDPSYRDSASMPIELLWDENWEELLNKIREEREAEEKREAQKKRQRAADENKARDLRRLAMLENDVVKLKAKYKED
jgi:hypothetical protein